jgi:hypothetical protein
VGNIRTSDEVEIYSPEGKCQYNLAPLPLAILPNPILVKLNIVTTKLNTLKRELGLE